MGSDIWIMSIKLRLCVTEIRRTISSIDNPNLIFFFLMELGHCMGLTSLSASIVITAMDIRQSIPAMPRIGLELATLVFESSALNTELFASPDPK